VYCCLSTFE